MSVMHLLFGHQTLPFIVAFTEQSWLAASRAIVVCPRADRHHYNNNNHSIIAWKWRDVTVPTVPGRQQDERVGQNTNGIRWYSSHFDSVMVETCACRCYDALRLLKKKNRNQKTYAGLDGSRDMWSYQKHWALLSIVTWRDEYKTNWQSQPQHNRVCLLIFYFAMRRISLG